jgi:hypothetical protein
MFNVQYRHNKLVTAESYTNKEFSTLTIEPTFLLVNSYNKLE